MSSHFKDVERAFDRDALKRICEMHEQAFGREFLIPRYPVDQRAPHDYYYFQDNGADILAVAHLDTVVDHHERVCNFIDTAGGPVVYSGALDDRLGAYIILDLMPKLGVKFDVLLTVGEEQGMSTAAEFYPEHHHERGYNWMIEFDRGGTDVVLYDYEDDASVELVKRTGAQVGLGAFSDISYMEHLGRKGFNWGVGYRDYHSVRGHAYLDETMMMMGYYLSFHEANAQTVLPHVQTRGNWWGRGKVETYYMDCETCGGRDTVDLDTAWCEVCGMCQDCWYADEHCQCPANQRLVEELKGDLEQMYKYREEYHQAYADRLSELDR